MSLYKFEKIVPFVSYKGNMYLSQEEPLEFDDYLAYTSIMDMVVIYSTEIIIEINSNSYVVKNDKDYFTLKDICDHIAKIIFYYNSNDELSNVEGKIFELENIKNKYKSYENNYINKHVFYLLKEFKMDENKIYDIVTQSI